MARKMRDIEIKNEKGKKKEIVCEVKTKTERDIYKKKDRGRWKD